MRCSLNTENIKGGVTVQCKWSNSDMMLENLKLVACFQGLRLCAFQPAAISKLIALGHRYVEWVNGHQRASAEEGSLAISSGIVGETEKQRGRDVITVWGCRDRSLLSQAAAWCWTAVEGRTERERLTSCIPTHKNTLSSRRDKLLQKKKPALNPTHWWSRFEFAYSRRLLCFSTRLQGSETCSSSPTAASAKWLFCRRKA